jgi:hypothetical protein
MVGDVQAAVLAAALKSLFPSLNSQTSFQSVRASIYSNTPELSRFYTDWSVNQIKKRQNLVNFDLQGLNLAMLASPDRIDHDDKGDLIYDIFAVMNHRGSFSFGHYYTYVEYGDGMWYEKDDTQSRSISSKRVVSQAAYMLLYKKRKKGDEVKAYREPPTPPADKYQMQTFGRKSQIQEKNTNNWANVNELTQSVFCFVKFNI